MVCNSELVGSSQGARARHADRADAHGRLHLHGHLHPAHDPEPADPEPANPEPADPSPEPPPGSPAPTPNPEPIPSTRIDLTKKADRSTVEVGGTVTYTIKATNTGDAPAQGVHVAEQAPLTNSKILSLSPSQGSCEFTHAPASCNLGTINPGETVTIIAALQATHPGPMPNNVAVNTGTQVVKPPTAEAVADAVVTPSKRRPPSRSRPSRPPRSQPRRSPPAAEAQADPAAVHRLTLEG